MKNIIQITKTFLIIILIPAIIISCKKDKTDNVIVNGNGNIKLTFAHQVDGKALLKDTLIYFNEAGNHYMINQLMYFISEVTLYKADGKNKLISFENGIHYIDDAMPETKSWTINEDIPEGKYDSITFIFGINEAKNKKGLFVNPPENNMSWPEMLGGGYHYMMLNGKWKNNDTIYNLNFHLGIGSQKINDSISIFTQNYFTVTLPNSAFTIEKNITKEIQIIMNIEKWFKGAYTFDFNIDGFNIMMNQNAMSKMKANGRKAFSVGYIR